MESPTAVHNHIARMNRVLEGDVHAATADGSIAGRHIDRSGPAPRSSTDISFQLSPNPTAQRRTVNVDAGFRPTKSTISALKTEVGSDTSLGDDAPVSPVVPMRCPALGVLPGTGRRHAEFLLSHAVTQATRRQATGAVALGTPVGQEEGGVSHSAHMDTCVRSRMPFLSVDRHPPIHVQVQHDYPSGHIEIRPAADGGATPVEDRQMF